jgi:hypothetical protein
MCIVDVVLVRYVLNVVEANLDATVGSGVGFV